MIGTTLDDMLDDFRMEIGASTQVAQGTSVLPKYRYLLKRTQEMFYDDYNWPHLQPDYDVPIIPGERYYSFDAAYNPFKIFDTTVYYNNRWYPVTYGIGPSEYNISDPQLMQSQDPIRRWRRINDLTQGQQQYEVWPVPISPSTFRFKIMLALTPLIAPTDRCIIDDKLIVLTAAAEQLTSMGDKAAPIKQQAAKSLYAALKGNIDDVGMSVLGGQAPPMQEAGGSRDNGWFPLMAKGA